MWKITILSDARSYKTKASLGIGWDENENSCLPLCWKNKQHSVQKIQMKDNLNSHCTAQHIWTWHIRYKKMWDNFQVANSQMIFDLVLLSRLWVWSSREPGPEMSPGTWVYGGGQASPCKTNVVAKPKTLSMEPKIFTITWDFCWSICGILTPVGVPLLWFDSFFWGGTVM